jgi:hypothetical protein
LFQILFYDEVCLGERLSRSLLNTQRVRSAQHMNETKRTLSEPEAWMMLVLILSNQYESSRKIKMHRDDLQT